MKIGNRLLVMKRNISLITRASNIVGTPFGAFPIELKRLQLTQ